MNERALASVRPIRRDVILVLGMHRSGTSAVTGVMAKLGAMPPTDLLPPAYDNPRGHWESASVYKLNDELLASAGSRWDDWRPFDPSWYKAPAATAFRTRARELFLANFGDEPLVVLKDPRICRFAPFWLDAIGGLGAEARVVIPIRSPLEVAQSLRQRNGFPLSKGLLLWLRHTLDAEAATRGVPRTIVGWDDFLSNWQSVADKVAREIDVVWTRLSDRSAAEIDEFLTPDLKHQRVDDASLARHPEIHEWTLTTYGAMLSLAQNRESSADRSTLDTIAGVFDTACAAFGQAFADLEINFEQSRDRADALQAERERRQAQGSEANATAPAAALQAALTAAQEERDQTAAALRAALAAQKETEQAAAARETALAALMADTVAERDARIAELELSTVALRTRGNQVRDELRRARTELMRSRVRTLIARTNYDSIASSTTWRATEPARAMLAKLPLLRRAIRYAAVQLYRAAAPWTTSRGLRGGRQAETAALLSSSSLFDADWYRSTYPDVAAANSDPALHYLTHGAAEGRDPGPLFSTDAYLSRYPDVAASSSNPLIHYLRHGVHEGRELTPSILRVQTGEPANDM